MFASLPFMMFDGLLLYAIIGSFCIIELISMEYEKPGICTGILIIALIVLELCSSLKPLSFVYEHPLHALIIVGAYFAAGSLWIVIKWVSHVYKVRDRFNAVKQDCIREIGHPSPDPLKFFNTDDSLNEAGKQRVYWIAAQKIGEKQLPLQVAQHKAQIYTWWLCWPLSLFWTLLDDPITRLWNFVYNLFGRWMQRISDRSIELR